MNVRLLYDEQNRDFSVIIIKQITIFAVLPAVVLIVLAVARVDVRLTMGASICTALPICLFVQHMDWLSVGRALMLGYHCPNAQVAPLIDGGGVISMIKKREP